MYFPSATLPVFRFEFRLFTVCHRFSLVSVFFFLFCSFCRLVLCVYVFSLLVAENLSLSVVIRFHCSSFRKEDYT
jgi:hypothetical protein